MTDHRDTHQPTAFAPSAEVVAGLVNEVNRLRNELAESDIGRRVMVAAMSEERDGLERMIRVLNDSVHRVTAERDEARRLLKSVMNMMRENMVPDATHPKHLCDFIHRPDIAMCRVCEDWTDAMVLCYPDEFQDKEDGK